MATRCVFKKLFAVTSLPRLQPQTFFSGVRSLSTTGPQTLDISGVFTPIATPFKEDGSISYEKLRENFQKWNSTSLRGYLVEGSNGEVVLLSTEERVQLVEEARALVPKDKLLLAGAGCEGTTATVRMSQQMAAAGADAVMVVTPSYYKGALTDRALIHHFETVANHSPIPVLLYSVPANTGIDLSLSAVKVLAQHPNIVGAKDSGGDVTKIATMVHTTKEQDFQVLAGSAGYLLAALQVGSVGGVCALGNVLPDQVCQLYHLFNSRNGSELLSLQQRLLAPNTAVTRSYGVAGLKQAMDWLGWYGGPTRKPLMPLLEQDKLALRKIFVQSGFLED